MSEEWKAIPKVHVGKRGEIRHKVAWCDCGDTVRNRAKCGITAARVVAIFACLAMRIDKLSVDVMGSGGAATATGSRGGHGNGIGGWQDANQQSGDDSAEEERYHVVR